MFEKILDELKNPVRTVIEKSEQEDMKKGIIKTAIISAVMALISIITTVISIFSLYSKKSFYYSYYSEEELKEAKLEAIKDAELFGTFFRELVIFAVIIAVFALILFIIARIVKSPKNYSNVLSMTNNTTIVMVLGYILEMLISLIYAPIGWFVLYAIFVYAIFTLINAFRDSLDIESSDKLVLTTTGVLVAALVIIVILVSCVTGVSLKDLDNISSLLSLY